MLTAPVSTKARTGPRKVAFHHGATSVSANSSGLFLVKPGTCSGNCHPPVDVTSKVPRLHHTYITIRLPRLPLDLSPQAKYLQSVEVLLEILRMPSAVDSTVVLYVFPYQGP